MLECCSLTLVALCLMLAIAANIFLRSDPEALYGKYRKFKGRWFYTKFCVFYLYLQLRKWKMSHTNKQTDIDSIVKTFASVDEMEKIQTLSSNPKAIDAVFFTGASTEGVYFVLGFARRPKLVVDGFIMLRIPGVGLLLSPRLPEALMKADNDEEYSAEGLRIEAVQPMRHWRVSYSGKLRDATNTDKLFDVNLQLNFKSHLPHFDFNVHTSIPAMAKAVALEPWSRQFFQNLEEAHQNHYEQMGTLEGEVAIEGKGTFPLRLNHAYRDHSSCYKREWKYFHRYILHNVTVEDGTRFMVGRICIPISMSMFECGYVYTPSGIMHAVDWCDLPMWYIGENGDLPDHWGFNFGAGGETYIVKAEALETSVFYIGKKWEARIFERMCSFTVNGKKAWGFSEWQYRNNEGRNEELLPSTTSHL